MKVLKLQYAPTIILIVAVVQMGSLASAGLFQDSYSLAGIFGVGCLVSGILVYFYLKDKDLTAARMGIATGVLFFVMLFGIGEYLFSTYFPG